MRKSIPLHELEKRVEETVDTFFQGRSSNLVSLYREDAESLKLNAAFDLLRLRHPRSMYCSY